MTRPMIIGTLARTVSPRLQRKSPAEAGRVRLDWAVPFQQGQGSPPKSKGWYANL